MSLDNEVLANKIEIDKNKADKNEVRSDIIISFMVVILQLFSELLKSCPRHLKFPVFFGALLSQIIIHIVKLLKIEKINLW